MQADRTTNMISTDMPMPKQAAVHWTACLIVLKGAGIGNRILLNKNEMTIGRTKDTDICLMEAGVSRHHAVIRRLNEQDFLLADTHSTNGTFLNADKIEEAVLQDRDLIAIGDCRLKFIAADNPEQPHYEELYRQAHMDKACQVYNKHYFLSRLDEEVNRCRRSKSPLSLILLDADHFNRINDTYGCLAGDAALLQLADTIKKHIRNTDLLCHYGGEEFAVILPNTPQQQAYVIAEQIRVLVAQTPVCYDGGLIDLTISLGVSAYMAVDPHYNKDSLIRQADKALYAAKHSGKNKVMQFNPLS